jgi:uncharacterized membrane protein YedE/YeeE
MSASARPLDPETSATGVGSVWSQGVRLLFALAVGLVFGIGLIASGMSNPAKVKAFLDLAGAWDPSLAFVMAGAITVAALPFALAKRRARAWSGEPIVLPGLTPIDARLWAGALLFGVGWGMVGFCPGPWSRSAAGSGPRCGSCPRCSPA